VETGAAPVIAQLTDVSPDLPSARAAKKATAQEVGYRFDPPQMADRRAYEAGQDRAAQFRTLKSELQYVPVSTRSLRPHVFDKTRAARRRKPMPRRDSPILPRANTFAIPRRGLLDSIAPALQFALLVALFTVAGTWVQMALHKNQGAAEPIETAKATDQRPMSGAAGKTVNGPPQAPTAIGPVRTTPESGTRVGRVRSQDDFATLRGDIMPVEPEMLGSTSPGLVGPGLPHVQFTEPPKAVVSNEVARAADLERPTEVARVPGFSVPPSR
jgi:hypothetical protein